MKYNNIAIFCDNNEEIMMFLNYCQDIGLLWRNGEKPLEFIPRNYNYKKYFIIENNKITYGRVEDYKEFIYIISVKKDPVAIIHLHEFIKTIIMPTEQKLIDFLNG